MPQPSTPPVPRELAELRGILARGELVLFVGAGVSRSAGLPTWQGLVSQLVDVARTTGAFPQQLAEIDNLVGEGKLIDAMTELESALTPAGFGREVEQILDDSQIANLPPIFHALAGLSPRLRGVITTNLDRLLERAFGGGWTPHARPVADLATREKWIFKLHGTLPERSTWVLTRAQYRHAIYADPLQQALVHGLFWGGLRMLFVGFGLQDPDFDAVLDKLSALAQHQAPRHFALVDRATVTQERRRRLAESGVTLVPYDNPDGSHAELARFVESLGAGLGPATTRLDKLPLLFLSSNPDGTQPLRVDRELRSIREAIDISPHRDRLDLDTLPAATAHDLRRALLRKPYGVLHISAHGEPDTLLLEDAAGKRDKLDSAKLITLLADKAHPAGMLRCVVLSACHSLTIGEALAKVVPHTIAMEGRLSDAGAIEFARGFYDALGAGLSIEVAFKEGLRCHELTAPKGNFSAHLLVRDGS